MIHCQSPRCRNLVPESCRSRFCSKCRWRKLKQAEPLKYFFWKLRDRARERGKPFSLTYAQYCEIAEATGYDRQENRGRTSRSLSIHRIRNDEGYQIGNVAIVTMGYNSRLQHAPTPAWMHA
jgi:hypothetical protein